MLSACGISERVIDQLEAERAVRALLVALGHAPDKNDGLKETPERVARAFQELLGGYDAEPEKILRASFEANGYDEMIALSGIDFYSLCEHHLLPFTGTAVVAYIPSSQGRVVGLSKLARLVDMYARRLQIQERMTTQIARALEEHLSPRGVGVLVRAQHLCMCARGVAKQNAMMTTSVMKGLMKSDAKARAEFMQIANT